jgi:ribulose-phosphate 3-epimerase
MNVMISVSILSADLGRLADEIARVAEGGADMIHIDVMDGQFVPPITFGANVVAVTRHTTDLPLDVHLMVDAPERHIDDFAEAGATLLTFHAEATHHVQRHLQTVRDRGMRAGLALNPSTPLGVAEEVVNDLDLLLIMTVNPGYPGQRYEPASTAKIARARAMLDRHRRDARLAVDGGIGPGTIGDAFGAGADTFAAGSSVFGADDPAAAIRELRRRCAVTV